jgi:hypothetical protein
VLDNRLDRLLRDRQRNLTSYQYQSSEFRYFDTSFLPSSDGFSCVTTLSICIQGIDDCKQAGSILKHSPRVTSLAIMCSRRSSKDHSTGRMILENICGAAHAHRGLLELTALRFEGIPLAKAGSLLQGSVVLEALQHLQLLRCHGVDPFLQVLSQKCSGLQSFAIEHCDDVRNIDTINDFLRATKLKRLVLRNKSEDSRDVQGLVSFDTLASLAHALECLVLDNSRPRHSGSGPEQRAGSSTDFEGLCKLLQSLQQLCVVSPMIDKEQWLSSGFLKFLVCIHTPRSMVHTPLTKHTGQPATLAQTSSPEACVS